MLSSKPTVIWNKKQNKTWKPMEFTVQNPQKTWELAVPETSEIEGYSKAVRPKKWVEAIWEATRAF